MKTFSVLLFSMSSSCCSNDQKKKKTLQVGKFGEMTNEQASVQQGKKNPSSIKAHLTGNDF